MQLDKEDTRRSNLNGKCVFNILVLLFYFYHFIFIENLTVPLASRLQLIK